MKSLIYLTQVDEPYLPKLFTPYRSGLWCINLFGVLEYIYGDTFYTYEGLPQIQPTDIGQLRLGLEYLTNVSEHTDRLKVCFDNGGTYIYDKTNYKIITNIAVNGVPYQVPWGKSLEIGLITGYSDSVDAKREDGCYYQDIYYRPCISTISDITYKRDRLFFGVNVYASSTTDYFNHDGKLNEKKWLGSVYREYAVGEGNDLSANDLIKYGFIEKLTITNTKVTVSIADRRRTLDRNMDLGRLNKTVYPFLDDDTAKENKIVPIAIGKIKNYKPICVNKSETTDGVNAKYILSAVKDGYTLKSVDNVWIQITDDNNQSYDLIFPAVGQSIVQPKPLSSDSVYAVTATVNYRVDFIHGLLLIPRVAVCTASMSDSEITYDWADLNVNYYGWFNKGIDESTELCGVDLHRIGYETFGGVAFTEWNYERDAWSAERLKSRRQPRSYSILIDSDMTITDYLKKVCESSDTISTAKGDGRYSVLVIDGTAGDIKYEITPEQLLNRTDADSQSLSEIVGTVKVGYGYAGASDNQLTYTDDSLSTYVQQSYHIAAPDEEFTTILADEASAKDKAASLLKEVTNPTRQMEMTVWVNKELLKLDVVDTIIAPYGRGSDRAIYSINTIKKSRSKNQITLTLNFLSQIKYDNYTQGYLFGNVLYGLTPYAYTHESN